MHEYTRRPPNEYHAHKERPRFKRRRSYLWIHTPRDTTNETLWMTVFQLAISSLDHSAPESAHGLLYTMVLGVPFLSIRPESQLQSRPQGRRARSLISRSSSKAPVIVAGIPTPKSIPAWKNNPSLCSARSVISKSATIVVPKKSSSLFL